MSVKYVGLFLGLKHEALRRLSADSNVRISLNDTRTKNDTFKLVEVNMRLQ